MVRTTVLLVLFAFCLAEADSAAGACDDFKNTRNLYFGDLHVHTSLSQDAYAFQTITKPAQAYDAGRATIDFMAVTDHAEFLTETRICSTPNLPGYDDPICQDLRSGEVNIGDLNRLCRHADPIVPRDVCQSVAASVWSSIRRAANEAYDECNFTTFIAYEYSLGSVNNERSPVMHRNVIFANEHVPDKTISSYEQPTPLGLWQELGATCTTQNGCRVLTIPHTTNRSEGKAFSTEDMTLEFATLSAQYEPVVEIFQYQGASECYPLVGNNDEDCAFEQIPLDQIIPVGGNEVPPASFVRNGLEAGLVVQEQLGVNPFHMGLIASTDTHNATGGKTDEATYDGHSGDRDDDLAKRLTGERASYNPGGFAAVWATENSRVAIFNSLSRREVYGTSGTRISLRFFGSFSYPPTLCTTPGAIRTAYQNGVPMGSDLARAPPGGSPSFYVSTQKDPVGAGIARLQIIKGWSESGVPQERVYTVAESGNPDGSSSLCVVWTDPDFDSQQPAFYYARVFEVPTPRWNTLQCAALGLDCDAGVPPEYMRCCDGSLPETIAERAWSSPIWHRP